MLSPSEKIKKLSGQNINVMDNPRTSENTISQIADNLIPEESLLDTTSSDTSNINLTKSINKNQPIDEPSNAVLLAGLQDLSVNNATFVSNKTDNESTKSNI